MHEFTPYSRDAAEFTLRNDAETLEAAHRLVEIYLIYLREHETAGGMIDANDLPAAKEAIVNAFRVVIATESRAPVRTMMMDAGMTLARVRETMTISRTDPASASLSGERDRLEAIFRHAMTMAESRKDWAKDRKD